MPPFQGLPAFLLLLSALRPSTYEEGASVNGFQELASFIWGIANLLRGAYRPSQYENVMLPFTVLRRLDCVLEPTMEAVLREAATIPAAYTDRNRERLLNKAAGKDFNFHNTSGFTFQKLLTDPDHLAANLRAYINGFSSEARLVFIEHFKVFEEIDTFDKQNLLFLLVQRFAEIDLHPDKVPNVRMGQVFEELIRRFAEQSNEQAGDHFTPREVIRLMVTLLFIEDLDDLRDPEYTRILRLLDPACGSGGMLSCAEEFLLEINPHLKIYLFGQERNNRSYAICRSDMLIKGQDPRNIRFGNSFTHDQFEDETFNYMLCNPPYGVDWKAYAKFIQDQFETLGFRGRFGAGLPRINDGQFLFVQHMISKMARESEPSRIAVIMNGSPLFVGDAGSGESEIRRWIIENDWLEAVVALPTDLFYNTPIATYIWLITNKKTAQRRGKIQLINAVDFWEPVKKSYGSKRRQLSEAHIETVKQLFLGFRDGEHSRVFDNEDFGYRKITVERPLRLSFEASPERLALLKEEKAFAALAEAEQGRVLGTLNLLPNKRFPSRAAFERALDEAFAATKVPLLAPVRKAVLSALSERDDGAEVCTDARGKPEPDPDRRDTENVPLKEDVRRYFEREVLPHVSDAWVSQRVRDPKDGQVGKVGYEINFNRTFYRYTPPRRLEAIKGEIRDLEERIVERLRRVAT